MNENLVTIKTAIVAGCTALGAFLGWKGVMLIAWVAVMALDYLTGTLAACKTGQWSSTTARAGLWHKGGMIAVVIVSALADWIMAPGHTKAFCPNSCLTMRCFLRSSQMMEEVGKTISGTERH